LHRLIAALIRTSPKHSINLIRNSFISNGKPTIYAATHVFYDDAACALSTIEDSVFVLYGAGGNAALPTTDRAALWLNGYIPVRRWDKNDRRISMEKWFKYWLSAATS